MTYHDILCLLVVGTMGLIDGEKGVCLYESGEGGRGGVSVPGPDELIILELEGEEPAGCFWFFIIVVSNFLVFVVPAECLLPPIGVLVSNFFLLIVPALFFFFYCG